MTLKAIDGLPILDAKHSLPLEITQSDIDRADKKNPSNCAAAIACRRQHHVAEVRIHLGRIYVRQNKNNWMRYVTPKSLRSEIIAFDRGGSFMPGIYDLLPLPKSMRSGRRTGTEPKYKHARNNPKRKTRHPATIVKDVRTGPA